MSKENEKFDHQIHILKLARKMKFKFKFKNYISKEKKVKKI